MNTRGIDPRRARVTPLEWIWASPSLRNHILRKRPDSGSILVADFGPGENEEVSVFFAKRLRDLANATAIVYCIDFHELRLESLMSKVSEEGAAANSRFVIARLESMTSKAKFVESRMGVPASGESAIGEVDRTIMNEFRVPTHCFDIGVLNNDMVGYLSEYYRSQSDLESCLSQIHSTMRPGSLLIVTQPGLLYRLDTVSMLEKRGFVFRECVDIDLGTRATKRTKTRPDPSALSLMDHYSFLLFLTS